jgi:hypothetical protein
MKNNTTFKCPKDQQDTTNPTPTTMMNLWRGGKVKP